MGKAKGPEMDSQAAEEYNLNNIFGSLVHLFGLGYFFG